MIRHQTKVKRAKIPAKKQAETEAIFVRGIEKVIKHKLTKLAKARNMTVGSYLNLLIRAQE